MKYLLLTLLLLVLTACGASNKSADLMNKEPGKVTLKAALPTAKTTAKSVAAVPSGAKSQLVVTGANIPTAKSPLGAVGASLTVEVYPGTNLTVAAYIFNADGTIYSEAFMTGQTVVAGTPLDLGTLNTSLLQVKEADLLCVSCHEATRDATGQNLVVEFKQSGHYSNTLWSAVSPVLGGGAFKTGCAGCHGPKHDLADPAQSGRCYECHSVSVPAHNGSPKPDSITSMENANFKNKCNTCHNAHDTTQFVGEGCTVCHAVGQNSGAKYVQDNNGVRAITAEFTKWSHHVTGVALNDAHCAACHLEGTILNGQVVVDPTKHMVDTKTHLRDTSAGTDADFAWDPAAPNHSGMDTYCMSCHDADGAKSPVSAQIQAYINSKGLAAKGKTASASNPFGDTISNRYDKMQRPAVIDVDGQFATGNNSHHAVKGPKYTGRTRTAGARQIAAPAAFDDNSSATLWGKRSTIYDSVNSLTGLQETSNAAFNALYVPLADAAGETAPRTGAQSLGDDSTLHCGDCHTVGQWKAGTAKFFKTDGTVDSTKTSPAIGAHGSNNEYLLRNSKGTDERHTQDAYVKDATTGVITLQNPNAAFLVCFNCHSYSRYGSVYNATGATGPHAGEYDAQGRCNGVGNTLPFNGYTTGTATDGTQFESRFEGPNSRYAATPAFATGFPLNEANRPAAGEQNPDFGNIFGIQCNNCHNSGVENGYGGIHGSKVNTYVDGMGNTAKIVRFLPGLGNTKYVPGTLGGVTGGTTAGPVTNSTYSISVGGVITTGNNVYTYTTGGVSNDANWEQISWQQVANAERGVLDTARAGAGCYTLTANQAGTAATAGQKGLSVDGGATIPEAFGTWGGCDDHGAAKALGDHGQIKRINRPVTY